MDGEVVALDKESKPSFNTLQNGDSSGAPLFDLLIISGRDVMREPLSTRRQLLEDKVLPKLSESIRYPPWLKEALGELISSVQVQGLEEIGKGASQPQTSPAR